MGGKNSVKARIAVAEARLTAVGVLAEEREDRNKERFALMKAAVDAALASSDRAVTKAETATEKRFEGVNEFRAALADQATRLLSRSEFTLQHQSLIDRVSVTDKGLAEVRALIASIQDRGTGKREGIGMVGTVVLGIITVLASAAAVGGFVIAAFHH